MLGVGVSYACFVLVFVFCLAGCDRASVKK